MKEYFEPFFTTLSTIFILYFLAINLVYILLLILGSIKTYLRQKDLKVENLTQIIRSTSLPEITFILPIYNESANIITVIKNILNLTYRYKQLIIVNDGSTDYSLELIQREFNLTPIPKLFSEPIPTKPIIAIYRSLDYPEIIVIDKEHGTKYDSVNAGINACTNAYFVTIDADTFFEDQEFKALIRPILENPQTIAVGASVCIKNGCTLKFNNISTSKFPQNYFAAMQSLEYLRAFLMRLGWEWAGGNIVLSGAFSVFSRDVIVKAGGLGPTASEDLEIILRLHHLLKSKKIPYKMPYLPDPVAWTEGPSTAKGLSKQRASWHCGLLDSLYFHKACFFNPKYGVFGLFVFPFWVWGEAIEPLVEIFGYLIIIAGLFFGLTSLSYVALFLAVTWGFTFLFTLLCLLIEEFSFNKYPSFRSLGLLFWHSLIENCGYRQLTLIWRLKGWILFFKRFKKIRENSKLISELMRKSTL